LERSILVVDDDRTIVALLVELLDEEGYRVRYAFDGRAALQGVAHDLPDLVLTDVMMPDVDGLSLLRRLRRLGYLMPVVLMSAVSQTIDEPGVPFVRKPFDLDTLLAVITDAFDGAGS
jgi:DNA-binding response OmpR family regulator